MTPGLNITRFNKCIMRCCLTILFLSFSFAGEAQNFRKDWADFKTVKWKIDFYDDSRIYAGVKSIGEIVFTSGDHKFGYIILSKQVMDSGFRARQDEWVRTSQSCPSFFFRKNAPASFHFKEFSYFLLPCGNTCSRTKNSACSKFYRKIRRFTLK